MHENLGASLSSPSGRVLPQDPGGCCALSEQQLATGLAVALGPPHGTVRGKCGLELSSHEREHGKSSLVMYAVEEVAQRATQLMKAKDPRKWNGQYKTFAVKRVVTATTGKSRS